MKNIVTLISLTIILVGINSTVYAAADKLSKKNLNHEIFTEEKELESTPHFETKIGQLFINGEIGFATSPETLKKQWAKTINN